MTMADDKTPTQNTAPITSRELVNQVQELLDRVGVKDGAIYEALVRISTSLRDHIENGGEAHGIEPSDIGLGNLKNYPVSTIQDAIDGKDNQSFMTPETTAKAIEARTVTIDGLASIVSTLTDAYDKSTDVIRNS